MPDEGIQLLADGLALVYHEARHVRYLIKSGFLPKEGWDRLVGLPTNRIQAWIAIQDLRIEAVKQTSASGATAVFRRKFRKDLTDLADLYSDQHWKHASAVGGHAWRGVTKAVADLAEAIQTGDPSAIRSRCQTVVEARHNNGLVRDKITQLDKAVEVHTHPIWTEQSAGA